MIYSGGRYAANQAGKESGCPVRKAHHASRLPASSRYVLSRYARGVSLDTGWRSVMSRFLFRYLFFCAASLLLALMLTGEAPGLVQAAPAACPDDPATPAGLTSTVDRSEFCVYYDPDETTADQAAHAADHVQEYWDRYVTDFGFNIPLHDDKLEVWLEVVPDDCNGATGSGVNYMYAYTGCYDTPESIQKVLGHELFHRIQYTYHAGEVTWFKEGTARGIEDQTFDAIDNWATSLTAVSSSFNKQVNNYLGSPNQDLTTASYNACLWWKYFSEQFGSTAGEPQLGVDAYLRLWQAAVGLDDIWGALRRYCAQPPSNQRR